MLASKSIEKFSGWQQHIGQQMVGASGFLFLFYCLHIIMLEAKYILVHFILLDVSSDVIGVALFQ